MRPASGTVDGVSVRCMVPTEPALDHNMGMAEASNADQLHGSLSGAASGAPVHSRRINRRELCLLGGIIVAPIGLALLFAVLVLAFNTDYLLQSTEGWLLISTAALIAIGLMLIGSGMTGRAARLGEIIFTATPGGLLAAVGFTVTAYLRPIGASPVFMLTWISLAFLGVLWIIVGPIFMYRAKTRLLVGSSDRDANESVPIPNHEANTSRSGTVATWFLVLATVLGPPLSVLLNHFLGS